MTKRNLMTGKPTTPEEDDRQEMWEKLDRFRETNKELLMALRVCVQAIEDNGRSAGMSIAGFNAIRLQLAQAERQGRAAIARAEGEDR